MKNFREPIKDLEVWLASKNAANQNRWEVYYSLFQSSQPSKAQNEDLLLLENSDGSKTTDSLRGGSSSASVSSPKRLSLREEIELRRQEMLAYYASLKESEQQETLGHQEHDEKTEPQSEEKTDV